MRRFAIFIAIVALFGCDAKTHSVHPDGPQGGIVAESGATKAASRPVGFSEEDRATLLDIAVRRWNAVIGIASNERESQKHRRYVGDDHAGVMSTLLGGASATVLNSFASARNAELDLLNNPDFIARLPRGEAPDPDWVVAKVGGVGSPAGEVMPVVIVVYVGRRVPTITKYDIEIVDKLGDVVGRINGKTAVVARPKHWPHILGISTKDDNVELRAADMMTELAISQSQSDLPELVLIGDELPRHIRVAADFDVRVAGISAVFESQ